MDGRIIAIFAAPQKHAAQLSLQAVQLKAGKGIVGDRFFGLRKTQPGRNLTLIESEVIEEFNQAYQLNIPVSAPRRNLVTQGIWLNQLVGKTFKIGEVLCRGIELCEPCKVMARQFPAGILPQAEIICAFAHKGGIRAEVLADGIVRMGDKILM